ncbi:XkdF-like putative serine protease domain-containing protein [Bacillus cereus]|uniref:XkdF-like putative serine protease domain-containing protein n=1 Tax=Bacillus cereus TaxID=1396 RepID=UPI0009378C55|nr:XkdF-like putative serine protease domain-containing protein [Bacillus cereus]OKA19940.1 hypothetical protein BJR05_26705 [Bacillus cereus]
MKKRKLKNLQVSHVSYVNAGANKREFFLTKSDEKPNFEKEVRVIKSEDEEKRLVYGIVYEPGVLDNHNDFADESTIEKAAHEFMLKYRQIDKDHDFKAGVGEVVESYIAPADMEVNGETITKGTWILVTKATEEVWEAIQKGDYKGYSLAGVAETEVIEEEVTKTEEKQFKSFFQLMKDFFGGKTERPEVKTLNVEPVSELTFLSVVEKAGKKISNTNMADIDAAIESLTNLKTRVMPLQEGAGSEEDNMNPEQLEKALEAVVAPIKKELETVKKHLNIEPEKTPEELAVAKAVEAATAPIIKELEELKKSQGISNQQDTDDHTNVQKSAGGYAGYFGN